jgi:hypothetical protein
LGKKNKFSQIFGDQEGESKYKSTPFCRIRTSLAAMGAPTCTRSMGERFLELFVCDKNTLGRILY